MGTVHATSCFCNLLNPYEIENMHAVMRSCCLRHTKDHNIIVYLIALCCFMPPLPNRSPLNNVTMPPLQFQSGLLSNSLLE